MTRGLIISGLLLTAFGVLSVSILSYLRPVLWHSKPLRNDAQVLSATQAQVPLAFEIEVVDGKMSAGYLYRVCGSPRPPEYSFAGVSVRNLMLKREGRSDSLEKRATSFPCWPIPILLAAYPAVAFLRGPVRRYRRSKKGLCIACGYNLKGNTTGFCSECGASAGDDNDKTVEDRQ